MPDLYDQLSDAQAEAPQPTLIRTIHTFTFVYRIADKWHNVTYEGPLSDCTEAATKLVAKRGVDIDKIRWARGHMDGRRLVIHPKTDSEAEAEIKKVMACKVKAKKINPA